MSWLLVRVKASVQLWQKLFSNENCRVSIIARQAEKLAAICERTGGERAGHAFFPADLMNRETPEQITKKVLAKQGPIDIVIHNLGCGGGKSDVLGAADEWSEIWRMNVGVAIDINNNNIPSMIE
jgi:NADP-dependent 3-hydroxy acid dehydrogenase YdfG